MQCACEEHALHHLRVLHSLRSGIPVSQERPSPQVPSAVAQKHGDCERRLSAKGGEGGLPAGGGAVPAEMKGRRGRVRRLLPGPSAAHLEDTKDTTATSDETSFKVCECKTRWGCGKTPPRRGRVCRPAGSPGLRVAIPSKSERGNTHDAAIPSHGRTRRVLRPGRQTRARAPQLCPPQQRPKTTRLPSSGTGKKGQEAQPLPGMS